MMDTETNDKAIDALNKLFDLTEKPESAELYKIIRQALTPQSSADMGRVRGLLEGIARRPDLPNPDRDADWKNCQKWSSHDAKEALALLEQQPTHIQGDGGKGLIDQQTSAGHKFTVNDEGLAVCDHCKEPMTFPVKKCFGLLTELKAAVEGMKSANKPWTNIENCECKVCLGYNAALSAVADKIDEMIRRG